MLHIATTRRRIVAAAPLALAVALGLGSTGAQAETAYDFTLSSIDGGELPLAQWRGKVLLVVNTASFCGFTPQYEGLQTLWTRFKDQGLVVVGVPSNDFGAQEPGSATEIKEFCQGAYSVTFPLADKVAVLGDGAHPLYKWLTAGAGAPRWNFHKYLLGRDGRLVGAYPSRVHPLSGTLVKEIEAALTVGGKS